MASSDVTCVTIFLFSVCCHAVTGVLHISPAMEGDALLLYPIGVSLVSLQYNGDMDNATALNGEILQLEGRITTAETDYMLIEDFEDLNGWSDYEDGVSTTVDPANGLMGSGSSLKLEGGSGGITYFSAGRGRSLPSTSSKPRRATFNMMSSTTDTDGPIICWSRKKGFWGADEASVIVGMTGEGTIALGGPSGSFSSGFPYRANEWYKVDVVFNFGSKKTDLYVNEQLVAADYGFYDSDTNGFNNIFLYNAEPTTSWIDELELVDNEAVYTTVPLSPSTISLSYGLWEGEVTPQAKASNVRITVSVPNGPTLASSNSFNVIDGCQPGFYSTNYNSPCLMCPAGTMSQTISATTCLTCPVGTQSCQESTQCCEDTVISASTQSQENIVGEEEGTADDSFTMALIAIITIGVAFILVLVAWVTSTIVLRVRKNGRRKEINVELPFPKSVSYYIYPGSADVFGGSVASGSGCRSSVMIPPSELTLEIEDDMTPFVVDFKDLHSECEPEVLGKGAFGVVYKIMYKEQVVAVKELFKQNISASSIGDFIREAKIMCNAPPHPNVIKFIGICLHPLCIITEFMPQGCMFSYLEKHSFTVEFKQKVKWMLDISKGMEHLAHHGIIHRDLAARNVLLTGSLTAAVADFGFARATELTAEHAVYSKTEYGPLKWMSVEALHKRKFSEKSDVWSFGITCMEILTEEEPYGSDMESVQVATMVLTEGLRPKVPPTTPETLADLLAKCWAEDPSSRPDFQLVSEELEAITECLQ